MFLYSKIALYPSSVKPLGKSQTLPNVTAAGSLKDALSTKISGHKKTAASTTISVTLTTSNALSDIHCFQKELFV